MTVVGPCLLIANGTSLYRCDVVQAFMLKTLKIDASPKAKSTDTDSTRKLGDVQETSKDNQGNLTDTSIDSEQFSVRTIFPLKALCLRCLTDVLLELCQFWIFEVTLLYA